MANGVPLVVPTLALAYALWFGTRETRGLPAGSPELGWQVPSDWIRGRSAPVQTLTWGLALGPGLVTRNPYAGMGLLLLLVALSPTPFGPVAVGLAHGTSRALGVLRNRTRLDPDAHLRIMGAQKYWRDADGLALLLAAGALAAYVLSLQG